MDDELVKLYDLLVREGYYTKTLEDFVLKYTGEPGYKEKVFDVVSRDGFYTKSKEEFFDQYKLPDVDVYEDLYTVKKKDDAIPSVSSDGDSTYTEQADAEQPYIDYLQKDPFEGTFLSQERDPISFEERTASITKDIIQQSEEFTVPQMNYNFNKFGFTFEEAGAGNAMNVTSSNGQTLSVDLGWESDESSLAEVEKLQEFLKINRVQSEGLNDYSSQFAKQKSIIRNEEELKKATTIFNDITKQYKADIDSWSTRAKELRDEYNEKYIGLTEEQINADADLKAEYEIFVERDIALQREYADLVEREQYFKDQGKRLDRMVGNYVEMQSLQGNWGGGIWNSALSGVGSMSAGSISMMTDFMVEYFPTASMGAESYTRGFIRAAEALGYSDYLPEGAEDMTVAQLKEAMNYSPKSLEDDRSSTASWDYGYDDTSQWKYEFGPAVFSQYTGAKSDEEWRTESFLGIPVPAKRSPKTVGELIDDKAKDDAKKGVKFGEGYFRNPYSFIAANTDPEMGLVDATRAGARELFGDKETTEQWRDMQKESFWGGAILGLAESLPAMVGGNWAQRTANMYLLTTDQLNQEMESNPEFDDISESEKYYVTAPVGVAVASLETFGFRNVINQKGLLNGVIMRALGRSTKSTSAKTFSQFIKEDVESMMARGILTVGAGGLAEFETGAAQQAAEITIKEIYNTAKGKDMFQTPNTWIEFAGDVLQGGAQEAIGGFVLSTPGAIVNAVNNKEMSLIDDDSFNMLKDMSGDAEFASMYGQSLRQKVSAGEMTEAEAKQKFDDFNRIVAVTEQIPTDLNLDDQKKALELLVEKQTLYEQINGRDKSLVKDKTDRVKEIDAELASMSERKNAAYMRDGRFLSRDQFIEQLEAATPEEMKEGSWQATNDSEVTDLLANKISEVEQGAAVEEAPAEEAVAEEPAAEEPIAVQPAVEEEVVEEAPVTAEEVIAGEAPIAEAPAEFSAEDQAAISDINTEIRELSRQFGVAETVEEKQEARSKLVDARSRKAAIESKYLEDVSQEEAGIPSPVEEGQAVVEGEPIEEAGVEEVAADRDVQAPEEVTASELEDKVADIERRREEEIGTKESRSYTDEDGATTTVTITEDKDRKVVRVRTSTGDQYVNTYSKELSNDQIYELENADGYEYTPVEKQKVEGKRTDKINAKYDAELAALEQPVVEETVAEDPTTGRRIFPEEEMTYATEEEAMAAADALQKRLDVEDPSLLVFSTETTGRRGKKTYGVDVSVNLAAVEETAKTEPKAVPTKIKETNLGADWINSSTLTNEQIESAELELGTTEDVVRAAKEYYVAPSEKGKAGRSIEGYQNWLESYNTQRANLKKALSESGYLAKDVINDLRGSIKEGSAVVEQLNNLENAGFFDGIQVLLDDGSVINDPNAGGSKVDAAGLFNIAFDSAVMVNTDAHASLEALAETIVHEIVHARTSVALYTDAKFSEAMTALFDDVSKKKRGRKDYGFTNPEEMLAEAFSNPEFQAELAKIKLDDSTRSKLKSLGFKVNETKTFLEAFKAMVADVLYRGYNITKQQFNALDAVINIGQQQMKTGKKAIKPKSKKPKTAKPKTIKQQLETSSVDAVNLSDKAPKMIEGFNKAIKSIGGKPVSVYVVSNSDMQKLTGSSSRAQFRTLDDGSSAIIVNADKASLGSLSHEMMHAYVKAVNLNPKQIVRFTNEIRSQLSKGNAQEKRLARDLTEFQKEYLRREVYGKGLTLDDAIIAEEFLAEFVAKIKDGINVESMSLSTIERIRKAVVNILNNILGLKIDDTAIKSKQEAFDFINGFLDALEGRVDEDVAPTEEQGEGGQVGTISIPREQIKVIDAPKASDDPRGFVNKFVTDINIKDLDGRKFVTNMYDYTSAGVTQLGNGISIELLGGRNYVPLMLERNGKELGEVSNLAAFNSESQAEGFIRNAKEGNADLFAPHSGTLKDSWQFQHHIFEELVKTVLDNKIMSKARLMEVFNGAIKSKAGAEAFEAFNKKNKSRLKNLNSFKKNPMKLVELLDADNNYSPDLRKALNQKIAASKEFQKAIGIKNLNQFYNLIADPLNQGVEGGEVMSFVEFDPNTFEISKTKPGDPDHHPSFGWTVKAKIKRILQPNKYYKSYDLTNEYTKYNVSGPEVSTKADPKFAVSNVKSSAGAIPKVAKVEPMELQEYKDSKGETVRFQIEDQAKQEENAKETYSAIEDNKEGVFRSQIDNKVDQDVASSDTWKSRERNAFERFVDLTRRKIQDSYRDIIVIQEDIEYATGKPVGLDQDFRNAEVLMHGAAKNELNKTENRIKDIAGKIKKSGLSVEEVNDLLYAMHAQERNRYLRTISTDIGKSLSEMRKKSGMTPTEVAELLGVSKEQYLEVEANKRDLKSSDLTDLLLIYGSTPYRFFYDNALVKDGSGMTDVEARKILAKYDLNLTSPDVSQLSPKIRPAVTAIRELIADTRNRLVESGLESQGTIDAFNATYKNYVPLRGFADEQFGSEFIEGGGKLEVRGKEKRAKGRKRKADSPLTQAIISNTTTIIRGAKNDVMRRFYELAKNNPNKDIYEVVDPEKSKDYKTSLRDGKVIAVAKSVSDYLLNENMVSVRIDGDYKFIRFKDVQLADALRGANVTKAEWFTKYIGAFNRFQSSLITTYDPEFVLRNFSRDIQTAVLNLYAEQDLNDGLIKDKNIVGKTVKDVYPALKTIFAVEGGWTGNKEASRNKDMDQYYKEFLEDGAKTEWFYSKPADQINKDIEKLISGKGDGALKAAGSLIERVNSSVENAVRLSAYVNARKAGISRAKAAELAKNLTVNFNKSGEWGQIGNTLYLFFNASVQGSSRLLRSLKPAYKIDSEGNRKYHLTRAQKMTVGLYIMGNVLSLFNGWMSDEDEDGESFYSKIPDFEKERNIIIMKPNGRDYWKIPLPYGVNTFYVAGSYTAEALMGTKTPGEVAAAIGQAAVGSFSPINFPTSKDASSYLVKFVTPTIGQIPVSIALNENYFGEKIYRENFPFDPAPKPDSQLGKESGYRWTQAAAKWLNEVTGGSEYRSGYIDWNPDNIDFVIESITGGAGKFTTRSVNAIDKIVTGNWDELESRQIPFVRVFNGQPYEYSNVTNFYDRTVEVNQKFKEVKAGIIKGADAKKIYEMHKMGKNYRSRLKKISKLEDQAAGIKDPLKQEARLDQLEKARYKLVADFNKRYLQLNIEDI